ncbi:MAG: hypothetical protein ABI843_01390 [Dokdonella sp.]
MGSQASSVVDSSHGLAQRVAHLEAQALAWQLLINSLLRASSDPQRLLDEIEQDVLAWRQRDTSAARSPISADARAQLLRLVEGLREAHVSSGSSDH